MNFDGFLCNKNDDIDNAAYELLCSIAANEKVDWDMQIIGQLVDYTEGLLLKHGYDTCHPYYEGDTEIPCYLGKDCEYKDCVLRQYEKDGVIKDEQK